ncbi:uncharacterized protein LOC111867486 isoform X2 [Cryptotermes secundus]|nr:uncharacterized protein LOC111867486 isoform X2 [Cryptotermes secundus]XP_033608635.1 uncharacterized protein LOC111867486 isoform X2 [Cryptotermes secundus]
MPEGKQQITNIRTVPDMKTFVQQRWMMKRNSQLISGLYCIFSLCCLLPISANPVSDSSSPVTRHSKVISPKLMNQHIISTSAGTFEEIGEQRVNCNCLEKVPKALTAQIEHTVTESDQNEAESLTNVILSKIPIRIRNLVKQSNQGSGSSKESTNKFNYSSKRDFAHSVSEISADHTIFCNKQGLQQMEYFKLNNQIPWANQDYEETYAPGFQYTNLRLPYNQRTESSITNKYYTGSSQEDGNRISDAYLKTRYNVRNRFRLHLPRVVVLSLVKPTTTNLIWQALSVNSNTQQDSLAMSEVNTGNELEPIQEVKKNVFTSRGWGAQGMPFNVLYMYTRQHKKPVPTSEVARAERLVAPAPLQDFPTTSPDRQVVRNALSSTVTTGSNGGVGGGGGGGKSPLSPRWYYSIIPHFHATYGWGRNGK